MRLLLIKESFFATLLLTAIVIMLGLIPLKIELLGPIKKEIDDFDIYDLFFSGKERKGSKDPNIVLIQAAKTRSEILNQLKIINTGQPAVVGIDLSFSDKKDSIIDNKLISLIVNNKNMVPGYTLDLDKKTPSLIIEKLIPEDYLLKQGGYMNFSHAHSTDVIRAFPPFYTENKIKYPAFSSRIAEIFSPDKFKKISNRNRRKEFVNYSGNIDYYLNYSESQLKELDYKKELSFLKGKIVLLGFFTQNDSVKVIDDIFYSPLNNVIAGRSFPDMYGVVIHANILSMILNGKNYINAPSVWFSYFIGFFVSFFLVYYILLCYRKYKHPAHIRFLALLFLAILLTALFFLKIFDLFAIKVNLFPILFTMAFCVELFEIYKYMAAFLNRKVNYKTIFIDSN